MTRPPSPVKVRMTGPTPPMTRGRRCVLLSYVRPRGQTIPTPATFRGTPQAHYVRAKEGNDVTTTTKPGEKWHGTDTGYRYHACRCERCRAAHTRVEKGRRRERQRQGITGEESWHGTIGGYTNHLCRCAACREASTASRREYRAAENPKPTLGAEWWHGTVTGYNGKRCRCDLCRDAKRRYDTEYRGRVRGKKRTTTKPAPPKPAPPPPVMTAPAPPATTDEPASEWAAITIVRL